MTTITRKIHSRLKLPSKHSTDNLLKTRVSCETNGTTTHHYNNANRCHINFTQAVVGTIYHYTHQEF
jgi:hypothetical protein